MDQISSIENNLELLRGCISRMDTSEDLRGPSQEYEQANALCDRIQESLDQLKAMKQ
jgi:hypothetical protein